VAFLTKSREIEEFAEQIDLAARGLDQPISGCLSTDTRGGKPLVIGIEQQHTRNPPDDLGRRQFDSAESCGYPKAAKAKHGQVESAQSAYRPRYVD
jgi:hypothetical protein